jgi:Gluconate 2-dehydrogenase subunit 3
MDGQFRDGGISNLRTLPPLRGVAENPIMKLFSFSKWTRRKFLKAGLAGSVFIGREISERESARPVVPEPANRETSNTFGPRERDALRASMDQIIPRGEGMPAASEAGGVDYLERLAEEDEEVSRRLRLSLEAVDNFSRSRFGKEFPSLTDHQQVETLKELEKSEHTAASFCDLRDYVYEAYYTQPEVWKLLGYDFHVTNEGGPAMKPFDENALAQVRQKPKYYREVS